MLSYTKIFLEESIKESEVPDDSDFIDELYEYFPPEMQSAHREAIERHPLKRDIIATQLVNRLVNTAGTTYAFRMQEETGASLADIVRAHRVAREIFDLPATWAQIEELDNRVPSATQTVMYLEVRKLVERASRWFLRHRRRPIPVRSTLDFFAPGVRTLAAKLPDLLGGVERAAVVAAQEDLAGHGVPTELVHRVSIVDPLFGSLDIVDLSLRAGLDVEQVASVYFALGEQLHLDWLLDRILHLTRADRWHTLGANHAAGRLLRRAAGAHFRRRSVQPRHHRHRCCVRRVARRESAVADQPR